MRECAAFALCQLLSAKSMSTRLDVLAEIGCFYHNGKDTPEYVKLTDLRSQHRKKRERFVRSLQDFSLSLAAGIRKEGTVIVYYFGDILLG